MSDAQPQQQYQVRFDWGVAGFRALADGADVIVIVDALPSAGEPASEPASGPISAAGAPLPLSPLPLSPHRVIRAGFGNRSAVAEWVLARQVEKGGRFSVAIVAAGERRTDGTGRWAMEDLLAAGAVIDALSDLAIDHCSPEAAAASAAFRGLERAVRHLVSASETGQALTAAGRRDEVSAASELDGSREVPALGEFAFPA